MALNLPVAVTDTVDMPERTAGSLLAEVRVADTIAKTTEEQETIEAETEPPIGVGLP